MYAYPLIIQAINQLSMHRASMTREYDIHHAKGHLQRVFEAMLRERSDLPFGETSPEPPDTLFVMVGYSWATCSFELWRVAFDTYQNFFVWTKAKGLRSVGRLNRLVVIGSPSMSENSRRKMERAGETPTISRSDDVVRVAKENIARLLLERNSVRETDGIDMEPFEVLCRMIRDKVSPYVAGPPQVIKLYQSCSSQAVGVLWPSRAARKVAVLGRTVLDYERLDCPVIDPDTLECRFDLWPRYDRAGGQDQVFD